MRTSCVWRSAFDQVIISKDDRLCIARVCDELKLRKRFFSGAFIHLGRKTFMMLVVDSSLTRSLDKMAVDHRVLKTIDPSHSLALSDTNAGHGL